MAEPVPPALPPDAKPDRLTRLNTLVTVLAGMCTLLVGAWVKMNEGQLKEIEKITRKIESREKVEEASYKFAGAFLAQIKDNFRENALGADHCSHPRSTAAHCG